MLQSETLLTSAQVPFSSTLQQNCIHLLPGAQNIPEDLLHYVIAIAPQQPQGQLQGLPLPQQTLPHQIVVTDSSVSAPSEAINLSTASKTIETQSVRDSQTMVFF